MSTVDEALDVLACPRCGATLRRATSESERTATIACVKCRAEYPIRDGILDFLSPLDNKTNP